LVDSHLQVVEVGAATVVALTTMVLLVAAAEAATLLERERRTMALLATAATALVLAVVSALAAADSVLLKWVAEEEEEADLAVGEVAEEEVKTVLAIASALGRHPKIADLDTTGRLEAMPLRKIESVVIKRLIQLLQSPRLPLVDTIWSLLVNEAVSSKCSETNDGSEVVRPPTNSHATGPTNQ
jgi:hypothetical protein